MYVIVCGDDNIGLAVFGPFNTECDALDAGNAAEAKGDLTGAWEVYAVGRF